MTDKTAEEILDSVFWNKGLDLREITSKPLYAIYYAMESYASQKTSSLEAENKRLEEQLSDTKILLEAAERAIEERDELLKAAEEVIGVSRILGHFSSPYNPFWKSLKKYQSLKTKK